MELLTTYTHDSELQVITAPPLISTIHRSPHQPLGLFQPAVFTSRSLATASNSGDSSASRAQVFSSQPPVQNSAELTLSLAYNISARITYKTQLFCYMRILLSRCPETALVYPPISQSLHSNALHAIIYM
jgi:hypothetical protein